METKKNKNHIKSFYIPLLLVLVVIAGIVAFATSMREAKEASQRASVDKEENIPVVAAPAGSDKDRDTETIPEDKVETEDVAVPETEETPETEAPAVEEPPAPAVPTFAAPVGGVVTKPFSDSVPVFSETMNDYRVHTGVDVAAGEGEAVLAAADGTVGAIWDDPLMGKCMTVVHEGEFVTTYKGLNEILPDGIAQGVTVSAGQPIAAVGDTALIEVAEEPHVHFEMTCAGVPVDPASYVTFAQSETYED